LKDLEGMDSKVISKIYKYSSQFNQDYKDEANQITKQFRSGQMDPSRIIVRLEKHTIKKRPRPKVNMPNKKPK
jgi:hypothetical protein